MRAWLARHDKQRLIAEIMISTGLLRVLVWAALITTYLLHVAAVRSLYSSVSFVSLLSVLALLLTDWGQFAASLAQLTAAHAHKDAEHVREGLQPPEAPDLQPVIDRIDELEVRIIHNGHSAEPEREPPATG